MVAENIFEELLQKEETDVIRVTDAWNSTCYFYITVLDSLEVKVAHP